MEDIKISEKEYQELYEKYKNHIIKRIFDTGLTHSTTIYIFQKDDVKIELSVFGSGRISNRIYEFFKKEDYDA